MIDVIFERFRCSIRIRKEKVPDAVRCSVAEGLGRTMRQQHPTVPKKVPPLPVGPIAFVRGFEATRLMIKVLRWNPSLLEGMEQVA